MLQPLGKKYLQFYAQNLCLSKPMDYLAINDASSAVFVFIIVFVFENSLLRIRSAQKEVQQWLQFKPAQIFL